MKLNEIVNRLAKYYNNVSETEKTIRNSALVAAGSCAVGGIIPFAQIPAAIIASFGAVWTMYGLLCKQLDVPIKRNVLWLLAGAALSNLSANILGGLVALLFPGGNISGAVLSYACVYLAGTMFMQFVLTLAEKGVVGRDLGELSRSELKNAMAEQRVDKAAFEEACRDCEQSPPQDGSPAPANA